MNDNTAKVHRTGEEEEPEEEQGEELTQEEGKDGHEELALFNPEMSV